MVSKINDIIVCFFANFRFATHENMFKCFYEAKGFLWYLECLLTYGVSLVCMQINHLGFFQSNNNTTTRISFNLFGDFSYRKWIDN